MNDKEFTPSDFEAQTFQWKILIVCLMENNYKPKSKTFNIK
jgi:hypothetical protein